MEQQAFNLNSMKQRQRNLYVDIDRRINNVEAGSMPASGSSVPSANSAGNIPGATGNSSIGAATAGGW